MLTRHSPLHALGGAEAGWFRVKVSGRSGDRIPKSRASTQKKSAGPPSRCERTAAVQTIVQDRGCHTGLLLRRTNQAPYPQPQRSIIRAEAQPEPPQAGPPSESILVDDTQLQHQFQENST